ncbi:hypothetical protein Tco_0088543 [Tanacetum coccineum]
MLQYWEAVRCVLIKLVDTDTESHPKEAPSEAEESQPLGSRVPLMSEESEASKPSGTRTVSSHSRTPSPSSSPTLPVRKRYRGTSKLILDTNSEEDELGDEDTEEDKSSNADGEREPCMEEEEEEVTPEGQQQAILIVDTAAKQERVEKISAFRQPTLVTWVDPEDGKVYTDILTYTPTAAPVQTPPSLEWSLGSLLVSPSFLVVLSPIASPVAIPTASISVDEDQFLEVGAQDLRELYTRLGVVRDEIFLHRENHDLKRQLAEERSEQLELIDRVARMERRQESGGE